LANSDNGEATANGAKRRAQYTDWLGGISWQRLRRFRHAPEKEEEEEERQLFSNYQDMAVQ